MNEQDYIVMLPRGKIGVKGYSPKEFETTRAFSQRQAVSFVLSHSVGDSGIGPAMAALEKIYGDVGKFAFEKPEIYEDQNGEKGSRVRGPEGRHLEEGLLAEELSIKKYIKYPEAKKIAKRAMDFVRKNSLVARTA